MGAWKSHHFLDSNCSFPFPLPSLLPQDILDVFLFWRKPVLLYPAGLISCWWVVSKQSWFLASSPTFAPSCWLAVADIHQGNEGDGQTSFRLQRTIPAKWLNETNQAARMRKKAPSHFVQPIPSYLSRHCGGKIHSGRGWEL